MLEKFLTAHVSLSCLLSCYPLNEFFLSKFYERSMMMFGPWCSDKKLDWAASFHGVVQTQAFEITNASLNGDGVENFHKFY